MRKRIKKEIKRDKKKNIILLNAFLKCLFNCFFLFPLKNYFINKIIK